LPLVELTGGEPLLQRNSLPLMQALCDRGFTVLIETSGALDISQVDPRVHRIMDLKCPSSGESERNRYENIPHLKRTDEVKFVIGTREDYEWAKEQLARHKLAEICPVLFSWVSPLKPEQQDKSLKPVPSGHHPISRLELVESIIADALPVRFQLQMHKFIWSPEAAGSVMSKTIDLLRRYESRNITYIENDGSWPIVWKRAQGSHVWDDNGRKYLDLTAAFGVAAAGHANPRVVRAGQKQMAELLHAMGDVHPHARKAELARKLSEITYERWRSGTAKTIFTNSGFEAVEAALKTALLATGRSRVIAFEGAYHGLGYGALTTTHRKHFRDPFRRQLKEFATFVEFPSASEDLSRVDEKISTLLKTKKYGAVLIEPIQARGGIRIPPPASFRACENFAINSTRF
jgi:organic radical activating enzyme